MELAQSLGFELRIQSPIFLEKETNGLCQELDNLSRGLFRRATLAELGCAMAHRYAQLQLVGHGSEWGVILEGDALVDETAFLSGLKLLEIKLNTSTPRLIHLYKPPSRLESRIKCSSIRARRLVYPMAGAVGYALNKSAALELISAQTPIQSVADWPEAKRLQHMLLYPQVVHEKASTSLIAPEGSRTSKSFIDMMLFQRANIGLFSNFRRNFKYGLQPLILYRSQQVLSLLSIIVCAVRLRMRQFFTQT